LYSNKSELYFNIPENLGVDLPDNKELEEQLSLHNEKKICEIALLKKTLQHLSQQLYGKILRHLK
jgi:hypothetical protein